jgi:hypothetical protein
MKQNNHELAKPSPPKVNENLQPLIRAGHRVELPIGIDYRRTWVSTECTPCGNGFEADPLLSGNRAQ